MKKIAYFMLIFAVVAAFPFSAAAYNDEYVSNQAIWYDNNDAITDDIQDENLDGFCQYIADKGTGTLYLHISHGEIDIDKNTDVIELGINDNDKINYYLAEGEYKDKYISSIVSLEYGGREIYAAIDFNERKLYKDMLFTLRINGVPYILFSNEAIDLEKPQKVTTTKAPKETTEKLTKETTTKAPKTTAASKESTTKFKYNGELSTEPTEIETEETATVASTEGNKIITAEELNSGKTTLSPVAKGLMMLGSAFILSGALLFILTGKNDETDKEDSVNKADNKATTDNE